MPASRHALPPDMGRQGCDPARSAPCARDGVVATLDAAGQQFTGAQGGTSWDESSSPASTGRHAACRGRLGSPRGTVRRAGPASDPCVAVGRSRARRAQAVPSRVGGGPGGRRTHRPASVIAGPGPTPHRGSGGGAAHDGAGCGTAGARSHGEGRHPRNRVGSTADALVRTCERPRVLVPSALAGEGLPGRVDGVNLGSDARSPARGGGPRIRDDRAARRARLEGPRRRPSGRFPPLRRIARLGRTTWCSGCRTRCGRGVGALAHAAGNSGLVVVGRHSGRTALSLLPHTGCPVAVVPAQPCSGSQARRRHARTAAEDVRPRGWGPSAHVTHRGHGPL